VTDLPEFREAHVVAGHQPDLRAANLQQRRNIVAGRDVGGFLHGEGVVQVQLAVLRHDLAAAHGQVDAVDRQPGAGLGMECGAQTAHF